MSSATCVCASVSTYAGCTYVCTYIRIRIRTYVHMYVFSCVPTLCQIIHDQNICELLSNCKGGCITLKSQEFCQSYIELRKLSS